MRIYHPKNELSQALLNERHLVVTYKSLTKNLIDGDMLVDNDCVDWNRAGEVFRETDNRMTQNGMVFLED